MESSNIIGYINKLHRINEKASILKGKLKELNDLELEKNNHLKLCNHDLVLVCENIDGRLVGPVKSGYCLICEEKVDIIWNKAYLNKINFDFDSIIDVTEVLDNFDQYGLSDEEIKRIKKQRKNEMFKHAKVMFHEYLISGINDRELIKNDIKEDIIRLNRNSSNVKKLK